MAEVSDDLLDLGRTKLRWAICSAIVTSLFASGLWVAIHQPPTPWQSSAPAEAAVMIDLEPAATAPPAPSAEPAQVVSEPPPQPVPSEATPAPSPTLPAEPAQVVSEPPPQPVPSEATPAPSPTLPAEPAPRASEPPSQSVLSEATPVPEPQPLPREEASGIPPADIAIPAPPRPLPWLATRLPPTHHPYRTPTARAPSTVRHVEAPMQHTATGLPPARYAERTPAAPAPSTAPYAEAAQTASARTMSPPNPNAIPAWEGAVMRRLEEAKRYPEAARDRDQQGVVRLHISMNRQGRLLSANVVKSSGYTALDEEAVAMMHRAEPFPEPPSQMPGDPIQLTVPVNFSLQ
jgi:periplasmic protein TonB